VGGTSGAESEKNGERIGEGYLEFHGLPHSGGSLPYS